jgi:hypothetical protein
MRTNLAQDYPQVTPQCLVALQARGLRGPFRLPQNGANLRVRGYTGTEKNSNFPQADFPDITISRGASFLMVSARCR